MANIWRGYLRLLGKYPYRVQASTTAVLMGAGDVLAQLAIEKRTIGKTYEPVRSFKFFTIGLCFVGPCIRTWYLVLEKLVKGTSQAAALKKVVLDQSVFAPIFLVNFIAVVGVVRPDPWEEIKRKIRRDYPDILLANYKIWPAVQIVNFYFVPFQHRVLVVNFVSLIWNTFLAWKTEQTDTAVAEVNQDQ